MVIASVSVRNAAFPKPLRGFGFLVPPTQKSCLLGTLFSSALFPGRAPQGYQLLTAFLGGALEPEILHWPDERLWDAVRSELRKILKLSEAPDPVTVVRRTHAIPQYKIGHERVIAELKHEIASRPGLFLTGNYIEGISVSACMDNGERTAHQVAAFLDSGTGKG
jgi:oxygen-dependent protoporphyrinogen oxidase